MNTKDFEPYIDPNGLISNAKNPATTTGNGLLYTAESLLCLQQNGLLVTNFSARLGQASLTCEVSPGLFSRTPTNQLYRYDQEGPDDYFGLGVIAYLFDRRIAERILSYGQRSWNPFYRYYYNTSTLPDWNSKAWFYRFPALIAHLKWAARLKPNPLEAIWWFFSVSFCGTDQDGWILSNLMLSVAPKGLLSTLASKIRMKRFLNAPYKGSINAVYGAYFNDPNHPIAKWSLK